MKDLDRTTEAIESWMPTCANMCHSVPTCGKIAVWQLCRERQPFWNSHDGLNLKWLDQCHCVRSHGTSSSLPRLTEKNCYKVYSLNLIHEFTSLFSPKVILAGLPGKSFPHKHAFFDISVFCGSAPRSSRGWRTRIVIQQSEFDPWVHILVFAEGDCRTFA